MVFDGLCDRIGSDVSRSLFPFLQLKCSFQNICGNRETVGAADCFLHSLSVISERGISQHPFDRRYKSLWGRLVRGDENDPG
jgi:hypothetical protein